MLLEFAKISELGPKLRSGNVSSVQLTQLMLDRIESIGDELNAFISVTPALALQQAKVADEELAAGRDRGPLHGVPIAVKDLVWTKGIRTTSGSKLFKDYVPNEDAEVVRKLKVSGAVILGKTTTHELAYGVTSMNSFFGNVCNPWKPTHDPGGSSGGSAVAVAAGLAYGAIGTDTGCSIRYPAHCCGIYGFKPTFGLVSRRGVQPLLYEMDHVGPMTRSVVDAHLMMGVIAGFDAEDPYAKKLPYASDSPLRTRPVDGMRIGVVRSFFFECADGVAEVVERSLTRLKEAGAEILELEVPNLTETHRNARLMFVAAHSVHDDALQKKPEDFGEDVRALMEKDRGVPVADYARALHHKQVFTKQMEHFLSSVDVLAMPTAGGVAAPFDQRPDDYSYNASKNTVFFDYTGQPSISIPAGLTLDRLPVGLMLTSSLGTDRELLECANAIDNTLEQYAVPPVAVTSQV